MTTKEKEPRTRLYLEILICCLFIGILIMGNMILARLPEPLPVCKTKIVIMEPEPIAYFGPELYVNMQGVKDYICEPGTDYDNLDLINQFWVKSGRCAVLVEVCE